MEQGAGSKEAGEEDGLKAHYVQPVTPFTTISVAFILSTILLPSFARTPLAWKELDWFEWTAL